MWTLERWHCDDSVRDVLSSIVTSSSLCGSVGCNTIRARIAHLRLTSSSTICTKPALGRHHNLATTPTRQHQEKLPQCKPSSSSLCCSSAPPSPVCHDTSRLTYYSRPSGLIPNPTVPPQDVAEDALGKILVKRCVQPYRRSPTSPTHQPTITKRQSCKSFEPEKRLQEDKGVSAA